MTILDEIERLNRQLGEVKRIVLEDHLLARWQTYLFWATMFALGLTIGTSLGANPLAAAVAAALMAVAIAAYILWGIRQ